MHVSIQPPRRLCSILTCRHIKSLREGSILHNRAARALQVTSHTSRSTSNPVHLGEWSSAMIEREGDQFFPQVLRVEQARRRMWTEIFKKINSSRVPVLFRQMVHWSFHFFDPVSNIQWNFLFLRRETVCPVFCLFICLYWLKPIHQER